MICLRTYYKINNGSSFLDFYTFSLCNTSSNNKFVIIL